MRHSSHGHAHRHGHHGGHPAAAGCSSAHGGERQRHGYGGHGHGGHGHGGHGPGGRRRKIVDGAELQLVLLGLLAEQPRHGYELIREIETITGGGYVPSPGMIYPTLTLLQEMGRIEEVGSEGQRRAFALTEAGREHLAAHKAEVEGLTRRLADLAAMREKTEGAPVRRAMDNLRAAMMHRLSRGDVDEKLHHAVAAILDDAAQRVERL